MNKIFFKAHLLLAIFLLSLIGCTKYYNPEPLFEEFDQEINKTIKRKVLLISVDGLVGKEVQKEVPTNIGNLLKKAKYSFGGISDVNTSDPSSWTTLMSGYTSAKHKIVDDSYMPVPSGIDPHASVTFMPSFIYRLENSVEDVNSSVVVRDETMANLFLTDADDNIVANSDEDVKSKAFELLEKSAPDLLVLQFTSVLQAGKSGKFSIDDDQYAGAIKKVDQYIGEVVNKIETSENADFEDWLIIVTSSHGGIGSSYGGESFQERNVFTLYSQKDFVSQEINAEMMNALRFWGHSSLAYGIKAVNNESGTSNQFNLNESLTFEIKYNWAATKTVVWEKNSSAVGNSQFMYAPLLSKKASTDVSSAGWGIFSWNTNIAISVSDGTKGVNIQTSRNNGTWGVLTGRIKKLENGDAEISLFNLGSLVEKQVIEKFNFQAANENILTLGYTPNILFELPDFSISNLRIWKRALSDQEIKESICKAMLSESDLEDNKLLAEWNLLNADATKILNTVESGKDLYFEGGAPKFFTTRLYTPCASNQTETLLETSDVAKQVFYWLGIKTNDAWSLDGKLFLNQFEVEFLKP